MTPATRIGLTALFALAAGLTFDAPAQAAPARPAPSTPVKVVTAKGSQVHPAAAVLQNQTLLLSFERLFTAHRRRVYVQRRRKGFGWSWARALPLIKGDYTQRSTSLVVRAKDQVLLYVQVGDLRRRRAGVRLYESRGDSLRWQDRGRLTLAGSRPGRWVLTQPHAAPDSKGGVWLTVTRQFARKANGCYAAHATDGKRFDKLRFLGAGERCRVVATPKLLILTYQTRARRRLPWRSFVRQSKDGGKTWTAARPVSALRSSFDVHTLVEPTGPRFLFVVPLRRGSAVQSARWVGGKRVEVRLTRPKKRRDVHPFGLRTNAGSHLFFAREGRPLDFDVLARPLGP